VALPLPLLLHFEVFILQDLLFSQPHLEPSEPVDVTLQPLQ